MERAASGKSDPMRVTCVGGGPAGLYAALLLKKDDPSRQVQVIERCPADDCYGWGVVFSDRTLQELQQADAATHDAIVGAFRHWDDIDVFFGGECIRSGGHGFAGIARDRLLRILTERAIDLGVEVQLGVQVDDCERLARDCDLLIAADGVNSLVRTRHADVFEPDLLPGNCRYLWLGARLRLDAFTFDFRETASGWFNLHAYSFDDEWSSIIVETPEETWRRAGLDRASPQESIEFCRQLFAERLGGAELRAKPGSERGSAVWLKFQRILCRRWRHGNTVLIGDAAHTAHFSIGSGTKMAMQDAIALAGALRGQGRDGVQDALEHYERQRRPDALKLQNAARNRMEWFENVASHTRLEPLQFSYSLLTGSQRVGHASLKLRDAAYAERIERRIASRSGLAAEPIPPMFTPFRLRGLELPNRVVVSPMAMYSSRAGVPADFHRVHLGALALGGAGLVMTEMTCVSADARITPACAGIWNKSQASAWRRIVDFTHERAGGRIGMQLGHAGPKGSTRVLWQGMDEPLARGNWPLIAASALAYGPQNQVPREMTRADMDRVRDDFTAAAKRAADAGFDLLELHCAHGYLLSSFICPLTNRRRDDYGGSIENRCRFPLEVFSAVRAVWPEDRPLSVRISAVDWTPGGNTPADGIAIARLFKAAGADLIDVSSGLTTRQAQPVYGRLFQTPLADLIRNEVGIATIAVGNITQADDVNTIIAAGRADLCALGRPHLADPHWTRRAAAQLGHALDDGPLQYQAGLQQLRSQLLRSVSDTK
jgi:anthraniloyl-CoA monooxygenase